MRQKPARIKSCAVEDVRRLRNFLLDPFRFRRRRGKINARRRSRFARIHGDSIAPFSSSLALSIRIRPVETRNGTKNGIPNSQIRGYGGTWLRQLYGYEHGARNRVMRMYRYVLEQDFSRGKYSCACNLANFHAKPRDTIKCIYLFYFLCIQPRILWWKFRLPTFLRFIVLR